LIEGVNADVDSLQQIARFLSSLPGMRSLSLLPFHRAAADKHVRFGIPYRLSQTGELSPDQLSKLRDSLSIFDLEVRIEGFADHE
jgi:pyruvate formate lyase activating enzyme